MKNSVREQERDGVNTPSCMRSDVFAKLFIVHLMIPITWCTIAITSIPAILRGRARLVLDEQSGNAWVTDSTRLEIGWFLAFYSAHQLVILSSAVASFFVYMIASYFYLSRFSEAQRQEVSNNLYLKIARDIVVGFAIVAIVIAIFYSNKIWSDG